MWCSRLGEVSSSGARAGKFALRRSGDLWRLLASITLHKVYRQARRHTAERRSVGVEQSLERMQEFLPGRDQEPSPEEALALPMNSKR